jgi:hypothetical protein
MRLSDQALYRLAEVASDWELTDESAHVAKRYREAEAVLHEICHALEMGIQPTRCAPNRISRHFECLNSQSEILGLAHEAKVLAIQGCAIDILGWNKHVPMRRRMAQIWRNGLSGTAFPFVEFRRFYLRFRREARTKELGGVAAETLRRIARSRRRKKQ